MLNDLLSLARTFQEPVIVAIEFGGPSAEDWLKRNVLSKAQPGLFSPAARLSGVEIRPNPMLIDPFACMVMSDGSRKMLNTETGKGFTAPNGDFLKLKLSPLPAHARKADRRR